MTRCTQCLVPHTFPGTRFNEKGVCNHCSSFKKQETFGREQFLKKISSRKGKDYDCVLGISGGKDSCYVAYLAKKKFGLRALAVSYDFPFMVNLARENVKKVCGKLGLELLVIKTRNNLEYNLMRNHITSLAATGTTWGQCLFCHYGIEAVLYETARSRAIPFILSGTIRSELWWDPGSRMHFLSRRVKKLSLPEMLLFGYYQCKAYAGLVDQRRQFPIPGNSRFNVYKRAHPPEDGPQKIAVFDYIDWDSNVIEKTLREEAGWEKPSQELTWRYDCILEPLLDVTYLKEFGISSAGLYLCGLIRSGLLARDEGLRLLKTSEKPERLDSSLKAVFEYLKIPDSVQRKFRDSNK